ncbi:hypothetical protein CR513_19655, partial [Mucuna pruriens]
MQNLPNNIVSTNTYRISSTFEDRDYFEVVVHHGRHFVNRDKLDYLGYDSTWKCDPDRWSYFEIIDLLRYIRYYSFGNVGLKALVDDNGAMKTINIAKPRIHNLVMVVDLKDDLLYVIVGKWQFCELLMLLLMLGRNFGDALTTSMQCIPKGASIGRFIQKGRPKTRTSNNLTRVQTTWMCPMVASKDGFVHNWRLMT